MSNVQSQDLRAISDNMISIDATNLDQIKGTIYCTINLDLSHFGKGINRGSPWSNLTLSKNIEDLILSLTGRISTILK